MPLVEYSDSDDSDDATWTEPQVNKRKRPSSTLPPLPHAFHNLYASTTRLSGQDDPSLHGGRQRQTPHIEGNWPTHVYVECESPISSPPQGSQSCLIVGSCRGGFPSTEESIRLQDVVTRIAGADAAGEDGGGVVHTLLRSDLGAELPLHLSLSRPIVLRADQRQAFLQRLTERIENASVRP